MSQSLEFLAKQFMIDINHIQIDEVKKKLLGFFVNVLLISQRVLQIHRAACVVDINV